MSRDCTTCLRDCKSCRTNANHKMPCGEQTSISFVDAMVEGELIGFSVVGIANPEAKIKHRTAVKTVTCTDTLRGMARITRGKEYEVIGETKLMYVINDDQGYETAYHKQLFTDVQRAFRVDDVIDIRYVNGGLPNRIKIIGETVTHEGFQYKVVLESTMAIINMKEDFIKAKMINKNTPVYRMAHTKRMYADGWRFFGIREASSEKLQTKLDKVRSDKDISAHAITKAYNVNAEELTNMVAIWVRYKNPIEG